MKKAGIFLHEHQPSALPWKEECLKDLQESTGASVLSVNHGAYSLSATYAPASVRDVRQLVVLNLLPTGSLCCANGLSLCAGATTPSRP